MGMKNDREIFAWNKTGVFEETVNGIVVGYFVGWAGKWGDYARNIRAGLYFKTAAEAIEYRDAMENKRKLMNTNLRQIA